MDKVVESRLFDAPSDRSRSDGGGSTLEQRLENFAGLAKESTQLATRLRTNLNSLSQNVQSGHVGNAGAHVERISTVIAELSAAADRLAEAERSLGLRGELRPEDVAREIEAELDKKGVSVTKGRTPYWLVYPAWFSVGRSPKGLIEVVLNGEKLESIRPSEVASRIVEVVGEKFQPKQFAAILTSVRDLLRRAGAVNSTLALEDIFEVLAMEGGKRTARRKDFTRADFYYSVHRLAEEYERASTPPMNFPASDRSHHLFFTKDGHGRRYLTVEFLGAGPR